MTNKVTSNDQAGDRRQRHGRSAYDIGVTALNTALKLALPLTQSGAALTPNVFGTTGGLVSGRRCHDPDHDQLHHAGHPSAAAAHS